MKKIKILHGFLVALIMLYIAHFYSLIFIMPKVLPDSIYEKTLFGYSTYYIEVCFSIIFFIGLIFTQRSLYFIIKKGLFNIKSAQLFKTGGFLLVISGFLVFVFGLFSIISTKNELYINRILQSIPILIIGFSLIIFSDFIKKGGVLKQENDLTI